MAMFGRSGMFMNARDKGPRLFAGSTQRGWEFVMSLIYTKVVNESVGIWGMRVIMMMNICALLFVDLGDSSP